MVSGTHADAGLTLERFYEIAAQARGPEIDAALARFPASARIRNPIAIGLRAMKAVTGGDVAGGIALLQRGVAHATGPARQHLIDVLVPLLLNTNRIDEAQAALALTDDSVPYLEPAFDALRAWIAARTGDDASSAEYARAALETGRVSESAMTVGKVLQRTALAAFYREDFNEAQDRALESARWHERIEAFRTAATAYSILYLVAHDLLGDPDLARFYARRMTTTAHLAGDRSLEHWGVVAQLDIAAESGDARRAASLRGRLRSQPLNEQYGRERFTFTVSDVLAHGWEGRFEPARVALTALRNDETLSLPERALCDSLLSIAALGTSQTNLARRLARRSISQTATHGVSEPLFDSRRRQVARILAATVCVVIGDTVRGRRALTRSVDPDNVFSAIIGPKGIAESQAPLLMRGYARFLNEAARAANRVQPPHGLTQAEIEVLHALPEGTTLAEIAQELGKSRKTVERQVGSIYAKLHVANRTQAIRRARDLGLAAEPDASKSPP